METSELIDMLLSKGELPVRLLDGQEGKIFAVQKTGVLRVATKRGEANEEINILARDIAPEGEFLVQKPPATGP